MRSRLVCQQAKRHAVAVISKREGKVVVRTALAGHALRPVGGDDRACLRVTRKPPEAAAGMVQHKAPG